MGLCRVVWLLPIQDGCALQPDPDQTSGAPSAAKSLLEIQKGYEEYESDKLLFTLAELKKMKDVNAKKLEENESIDEDIAQAVDYALEGKSTIEVWADEKNEVLQLVDVSDPKNPIQKGIVDLNDDGEGKSLLEVEGVVSSSKSADELTKMEEVDEFLARRSLLMRELKTRYGGNTEKKISSNKHNLETHSNKHGKKMSPHAEEIENALQEMDDQEDREDRDRRSKQSLLQLNTIYGSDFIKSLSV